MTLAYIKKLGFQTWKTDIRTRKIYDSNLAIYGIVIANF